MTPSLPPPTVVVGVDGSRAGVSAALWAVDEAVGRGLALRLVAAAGSGSGCGRSTGQKTTELIHESFYGLPKKLLLNFLG